jgi:hypothetical protein
MHDSPGGLAVDVGGPAVGRPCHVPEQRVYQGLVWGVWDVGCWACGVGCGVWGVGGEVWGVGRTVRGEGCGLSLSLLFTLTHANTLALTHSHSHSLTLSGGITRTPQNYVKGEPQEGSKMQSSKHHIRSVQGQSKDQEPRTDRGVLCGGFSADDSKGPYDLLACPTKCLPRKFNLERWKHDSEDGQSEVSSWDSPGAAA